LGGLILISLLAACNAQAPSEPPPAAIPTSEAPPALATATAREAVPATTAAEATATEEPATATTAPTEAPQSVTSLPVEGSLRWTEIGRGLRRPLGLVDLNNGSGSLLILEQEGLIRVLQDGQVQREAFLDLTDRVGASGAEQGLLGMVIEPGFAQTGRFYLNYTDRNGDSVISRFSVRADDPARGDPASEVVLLRVKQPYANHNGGGLAFGPDGYLYISLGDGGSGGDPQGNAQNTNVLLGKLLRLDVIGKESYTIPADNPFAAGGGAQEIWAWGLRNPWRFSFDRLTGDLYIADVGQNKFEELDFYPAGSPAGPNFGWDFREGFERYEGNPPEGAQFVDPVWQYGRDLGCSVTGGVVYRGAQISALYGVYLYSDYCTGGTWGLVRQADGTWTAGRLATLDGRISAFGEDAAGEVYLIDHADGIIYRLENAE
jgi:glucose/arabinose dehydrogenase